MAGVPDALYVRARGALLDAAEALGPHLDSVVLVGAQAIYLCARDAELAVVEYTTDADLAVSPRDLADAPLLGDLLGAAGFSPGQDVGRWISPQNVYVDLMVPEVLAGPGSRGARLGPHGMRTARRAKGLEGALVDRQRQTITALHPSDDRQVTMWVAGPAALLVAKVHKIAERLDHHDRVRDKDALDVLRLLRAVETDELAAKLSVLRADELAGAVTEEALGLLPTLFGAATSDAVVMAVRAAGGAEDGATIASSLVALVEDLGSSLA